MIDESTAKHKARASLVCTVYAPLTSPLQPVAADVSFEHFLTTLSNAVVVHMRKYIRDEGNKTSRGREAHLGAVARHAKTWLFLLI